MNWNEDFDPKKSHFLGFWMWRERKLSLEYGLLVFSVESEQFMLDKE